MRACPATTSLAYPLCSHAPTLSYGAARGLWAQTSVRSSLDRGTASRRGWPSRSVSLGFRGAHWRESAPYLDVCSQWSLTIGRLP